MLNRNKSLELEDYFATYQHTENISLFLNKEFIKKKSEKYWSQPSLQQGGNSSHGNWQSQTKSEIYGKSLALQTLYSVFRNTAMHYQIKIFQMVQINM